MPIDIHKINRRQFKEQKTLTREDVLIICGDFGGVWFMPDSKYYKQDKYWLKWLSQKNFTILFVDGNHENFPLLYTYPVVDKYGGKVHQIAENVFHLMRGEIYDIQGKKFFCFGGARSTDKWHRIENIDWWPEEIPSFSEQEYGVENLNKVGNKVDFIITHCCGTDTLNCFDKYAESDEVTQFFKFINQNVEFEHWYFGHYHIDRKIDEKHTCMYNEIVRIV